MPTSAPSSASDPTAGLVVVNTRPPNAETPAAALAYAVTPSEAVYLRTNFGVPGAGAAAAGPMVAVRRGSCRAERA